MNQSIVNQQQKKNKDTAQGKTAPQSATVAKHPLASLQQLLGNHGVLNRYPNVVQAKLVIGQPGDQYEREAEQVATDVVNRIDVPGSRDVQNSGISLQKRDEPTTLPVSPIAAGQQPSVFKEATEKGRILNKPTSLSNFGLLRQRENLQNVFGYEVKPCIQTKLKTDQSVDQYEQEANRIADLVMQLPDSGKTHVSPVNRRYIRVQKIEFHEALRQQKTPQVEAALNRNKGSSQPLPKHAQSSFEARFGYDFSQVQIHADGQAAELAHGLNARAFTTGNDIYFGAGLYEPETNQGQRLLAHELTHVIQQSGSTSILQKDLDRGDLENRAEQIFNAVGAFFTDVHAIICHALQNLNEQDARTLISIYNTRYSGQREGRTLPEDLISVLRNPIHRYRAFNLLHYHLIHRPERPSPGAQHPFITADPEIREIIPGTQITYTMEAPEILGSHYRYQWLRRNDPRTVDPVNPVPFQQGPTTFNWEITWDVPGRHTVVCELSIEDQIQGYYEYIQVVRVPGELATEAFEQRAEALRPDLYISRMRNQLANLRSNRQENSEQILNLEQSIERAYRLLEVPHPELRTQTTPGEAGARVVPGGGGPGPFVPIRAILIPTAHPEPVPLRLFVKPLSDGSWGILDLTDPSGSFEPYVGSPDSQLQSQQARDRSAIEAAWRNFAEHNHYPAGQLMAEPPAGLSFPPDTRWSAPITRMTALPEVSQWLSRVGFYAGIASMALSVIPGGQPVAVAVNLLLIASAGAGIAATALEMLNRSQYNELRWDVAMALNVLDLVGCFAVGTGATTRLATRLGGRALAATGMREAFFVDFLVEIGEGVETGSDVASGFVLSVLHYQRIQAIRQRYNLQIQQPGLTPEQIQNFIAQMRNEIEAVLRDAVAQNGLILVGVIGAGGRRGRPTGEIPVSREAAGSPRRTTPESPEPHEVQLGSEVSVARASREPGGLIRLREPGGLIRLAEEAGVRNGEIPHSIPEGAIEVFMHGTTEEVANNVVNQQVLDTRITAISATGGTHGGQFYMTVSIEQALYWAHRTVADIPGSRPAVLGIAIDRPNFQRFEQQRLIWRGRFSEVRPDIRARLPPESASAIMAMNQTIVEPGAIEGFVENAFFFIIEM